MQASYYTARAVSAEAISQRLKSGILNPRLVYLNEDIMTKEQVRRMYNYITNQLRNRNLKLAFNIEDCFMDVIPLARYISGRKIKIYYILKTVNIKEKVPDFNWYSRMQNIINKVTADDNTIEQLKTMNSNEAEISQWGLIILELGALVISLFLGKNKLGQVMNITLKKIREDLAKSEQEGQDKSKPPMSVKMSEVKKAGDR